MPLFKGKSKADFSHNVKTEMEHGKSQPQSLAIAYSMKRKGKKMAHGGMLTDDNYQSECTADCNSPCEVHEQESGFVEHEGNRVKSDADAMGEDNRKLNQHGEMEEGPTGARMAEGGMMTDDGYQSEDDEMDMIGRIMNQRQKMYSKGGKVSNSDMPEADFKPNEFDDLHLRDDLESTYTGANSGDELGDDDEDDRRKDMVSYIMRTRRNKAQRNPNPA